MSKSSNVAQTAIDMTQLALLVGAAYGVFLLWQNRGEIVDALNPLPDMEAYLARKWGNLTTFEVDSTRWYEFKGDVVGQWNSMIEWFTSPHTFQPYPSSSYYSPAMSGGGGREPGAHFE